MLNGVTGAAEVPTVAVDSIEIGALKFVKQDLPVIFTSIMGNADGILGVAGFQDQRIDVDFKRDRVSVLESNGRRPHYSMVTARATRNDNGLMIVDVRVGRRIRAKAVIDTGAERTLGNLALQNAHQQESPQDNASRSRPSCTARRPTSPTATCRKSRKPRIGDMTLTNLEVIFADFHVFKLWGLDQEPAMLIGMDMLGVLERLVIDYRRNEVSMYGERSSSAYSSSAEPFGGNAMPADIEAACCRLPMPDPSRMARRQRRDRSASEILPADQPALLRGAVRDWPAVRAGHRIARGHG